MSDGAAPYAPDYASYNWTGAPADYSLTTNENTGGDSRTCCATSDQKNPEKLTLAFLRHRHRELEQMVSIR